MVRIGLISVGVLIGVVVVLALVGLLLPRSHTATSTVQLPDPPPQVWRKVRSFYRLPGWWPEVKRVERLPDQDGHETWEQEMRMGTLIIAVDESVEPTRLVTRIVTKPGDPFGGTWTYEIRPTDGGSEVSVTESGWVNNLVFRTLSNVFGLNRTIDSYLTALGRSLGTEVTPHHQRDQRGS